MTQNLIENGRLNRSAAAESLQKFLQELLAAAKLDLKITVSTLSAGNVPDAGGAEVFADLSGRDKDLLLERGAELLHAIEHLALRALRLEPPWQDKILLDSGGYRALRLAPAIQIECDECPRTPHCASGTAGISGSAHGECRNGRATTGSDSPGGFESGVLSLRAKHCN